MKTLSKRNKDRLLQHHLVLSIICLAALFILFETVQSSDLKFRLSLATGYVGLILLAATLMTGAFNVLRRRRNPVSTDLRRDIGIWCGFISLAHVVIGLQVHMGNMLLYFFREAGSLIPRLDLFGFANYTGLLATFLIVVLLALSNDFSLRRLGKERWKFLQRWNYALAVLVVLHALAYIFIEKRSFLYLILFASIIALALIFQISGFLRRKRETVKN